MLIWFFPPSSSAVGPDEIPFSVFKHIKDILAPILYDTAQGMISGIEVPYDKFNKAFLLCLPKTDAERHMIRVEPDPSRS